MCSRICIEDQEELNDLYHSQRIIGVMKSRRIRWVGNVAPMEERCMQDFDEEIWGKGTTWKIQACNIKTDLQEVGCEDMDWIDVAQYRVKVKLKQFRYRPRVAQRVPES